jgi:hypothetical protein
LYVSKIVLNPNSLNILQIIIKNRSIGFTLANRKPERTKKVQKLGYMDVIAIDLSRVIIRYRIIIVTWLYSYTTSFSEMNELDPNLLSTVE